MNLPVIKDLFWTAQPPEEWGGKHYMVHNGGTDHFYICPACGALCAHESIVKHQNFHIAKGEWHT